MLRIATVLVVIGVAGLSVWLTDETRRNRLVWDHWDVAVPDKLYRSGQLNPNQLEAAIKRYGLRTVVSFQLPGHGVEAERALCKRLKVDFVNLPMPGDGFGREEQFREVLAACDDPERRPVLVHCARGTCRTGAAVALYRFERNGWTIEDVQAEMARQTYRQGWLPGYVYGMVKKRPNGSLFEPRVVHDRNLQRTPLSSPRPDDALFEATIATRNSTGGPK
jgi:protein tyrosine phosphatase (PTP) superfamily phosphohydrolase (DUF442 family)